MKAFSFLILLVVLETVCKNSLGKYLLPEIDGRRETKAGSVSFTHTSILTKKQLQNSHAFSRDIQS